MTPATKILNWPEHLDQLQKGLDVLEIRLNESRDNPEIQPPVLYRPGRQVTAANEFSIGLGGWNPEILKQHQGIFLNNKDAETCLKRRYLSVTDLIVGTDAEVWDNWNRILAQDTYAERIFKRFTLVVEDFSPDSCFALIAFIGRASGLSAEMIPRGWVDYVREWELGHVRTTGEPFNSWGALHNALAHSLIDEDLGSGRETSKKEDKDPSETESDTEATKHASITGDGLDSNIDQQISQAWLSCLRFDLEVLKSGEPPNDISRCAPTPTILLAKACLNYEYQAYLHDLQHATAVQLLLPMKPGGKRLKLVDAYFEEEHIPIGAKKNFLRNDTEHTWLHDGFGLMGIYRPAAKGSGNDMVLSVDPDTGTHLQELWQQLEQLEDDAWNKSRPNKTPRSDLKGYPKGRRKNGTNAPEQPWYINNDDTLVAAPKRLQDDRTGSKLKWKKVLDAVWHIYNPVKNFKVKPANGTVREVHLCQSEEFNEKQFEEKFTQDDRKAVQDSGKRLFIANWSRNEEGQQFIRICPTFKRYLAACVSRDPSQQNPVELDELPPENSFEFLQLTGGFAIINKEGAFLIDDWRSESLSKDELKAEFFNIAIRLNTVDRVEDRFKAFINDVTEDDWRQKARLKNHLPILDNLTAQKVFIREKLTRTLPGTLDPEVLNFRKVLEKRWGIEQRIEGVYQSINNIENTLRSYSDVLTNRRIAFLTIFGFPLALFAGILGFLLQDPSTFEQNDILTSTHSPGLTLWAVLSLLSILGLILWSRYTGRNVKLKDKDETKAL
jgi:hypothetical protein